MKLFFGRRTMRVLTVGFVATASLLATVPARAKCYYSTYLHTYTPRNCNKGGGVVVIKGNGGGGNTIPTQKDRMPPDAVKTTQLDKNLTRSTKVMTRTTTAK